MALPMYEGDGYDHAANDSPNALELADRAEHMRAEAIAAAIAKLIMWFRKGRKSAAEHYLEQSVDRVDLEHREQKLARTRQPRYI